MAREKRDPRARRPSGCRRSPVTQGDKMTEAPKEGTPAPQTPNYEAVLEEQKAVIAAMNDKIKALESRAAAAEAKMTALSAAPPAPDAQKAADAKSELDKAYEKVLADLGIKKG